MASQQPSWQEIIAQIAQQIAAEDLSSSEEEDTSSEEEEEDTSSEEEEESKEEEAATAAASKQSESKTGKGRGRKAKGAYRLRKAPKRNLFWVVSTDSGEKHSKDPMPKVRAEAQMRALYAAKAKKGGQGYFNPLVSAAQGTLKADVAKAQDAMAARSAAEQEAYKGRVAKATEAPEWIKGLEQGVETVASLGEKLPGVGKAFEMGNQLRRELFGSISDSHQGGMHGKGTEKMSHMGRAAQYQAYVEGILKEFYRVRGIFEGVQARIEMLKKRLAEEPDNPQILAQLEQASEHRMVVRNRLKDLKQGYEKMAAHPRREELLKKAEKEGGAKGGVGGSRTKFLNFVGTTYPRLLVDFRSFQNAQKTAPSYAAFSALSGQFKAVSALHNSFLTTYEKLDDKGGLMTSEERNKLATEEGPRLLNIADRKMFEAAKRGTPAPGGAAAAAAAAPAPAPAAAAAPAPAAAAAAAAAPAADRVAFTPLPSRLGRGHPLLHGGYSLRDLVYDMALAMIKLAPMMDAPQQSEVRQIWEFQDRATRGKSLGDEANEILLARLNYLFENEIMPKLKGKLPGLSGGRKFRGAGFLDWLKNKAAAAVKMVTDVGQSVVGRVKDVARGIRLDYSPRVRQLLAAVGNKQIMAMAVRRDPLPGPLTKVLNLGTLGKWDEVRSRFNYDKVFHLALEVAVDMGEYEARYVVEKNQVINVALATATSKDTEYKRVEGTPVNLNEMLERTKEQMGVNAFFKYDAFQNNCQDFIIQILAANGLLTEDLKVFIKQPLGDVLAALPSYAAKVAKIATDLGGLADVAVQGRGKGKQVVMKRKLKGGMLAATREKRIEEAKKKLLEGTKEGTDVAEEAKAPVGSEAAKKAVGSKKLTFGKGKDGPEKRKPVREEPEKGKRARVDDEDSDESYESDISGHSERSAISTHNPRLIRTPLSARTLHSTKHPSERVEALARTLAQAVLAEGRSPEETARRYNMAYGVGPRTLPLVIARAEEIVSLPDVRLHPMHGIVSVRPEGMTLEQEEAARDARIAARAARMNEDTRKLPEARERKEGEGRAAPKKKVRRGGVGATTDDADLVVDEARFRELMGLMKTKAQWDALRAKRPTLQPYEEYAANYEKLARQRSLTDPQFAQKMEAEKQDIAATNTAYQEFYAQNPEYEPVMCKFDEEGNPSAPVEVPRGECKRRQALAAEKMRQSTTLGKVVSGLTQVGDLATEFVGNLPGIGKVATAVYKQFAPPGSAFYDPNKSFGEKVVGSVSDVIGFGRPVPKFMSQLEKLRISPDDYLAIARRKAEKLGLNAETLTFSTSKRHKLMIKDEEGKWVHFGAPGYNDHILYTLSDDPNAEKRRKAYRKRAMNIKGKWRYDEYSPNYLAIHVIW
jgi:hypothetical protein